MSNTSNIEDAAGCKWVIHYHHRVMMEPTTESLEARRKFIRERKEPAEVPTRLRLMRYLTEPEVAMLPPPVRAAGEIYGRACAYSDHAWAEVGRAWKRADLGRALAEFGGALTEEGRARDGYLGALRKHAAEMEVWHRQVCRRDCPWDGKTLFDRD
jgi:hypothetical protein